jgi:hypothetical protein
LIYSAGGVIGAHTFNTNKKRGSEMKHRAYIVILFSLFVACSTYQETVQSSTRKFFVCEAENAPAWSRANVAIFNRAYDHLVTTTDYSVATYYETCYVTRAKYGNKYEYTVVGRSSWEALTIECEIRNITNCDTVMQNGAMNSGNLNKTQIEAQEKNRAKAKKLPNGTIIFE